MVQAVQDAADAAAREAAQPLDATYLQVLTSMSQM